MANGSSIINTSAEGLPNELEDRAYAFCIGTQILQNPTHDPRDGFLSFKVNPDLFDVGVAGDAVGTTAIGLATSANTSNVASWSSANEIQDDGGTYGVYAISFAESATDSTQINVCAAGQTRDTVKKEQQSTSTDIGFDTFTISGHGYSLGDAVVIASGSAPAPLQSGATYYVVPSGADKIQLAASRADALVGSIIDITVSGGPVYLQSDDVFSLNRNGFSGVVELRRNDATVYTFPATASTTLRPFFWTRESSNSATMPVFNAIKVSGAS